MKIALDACVLIYLAKANLLYSFYKHFNELYIDQEVYNEVITNGKEKGYGDAILVEVFIDEFQIPVISVDIQAELADFRDPGETSTFIISKDKLALTNDIRAYKKLRVKGSKCLVLDSFIIMAVLENLLDKETAKEWLKLLNDANALSNKVYNEATNRLEVI